MSNSWNNLTKVKVSILSACVLIYSKHVSVNSGELAALRPPLFKFIQTQQSQIWPKRRQDSFGVYQQMYSGLFTYNTLLTSGYTTKHKAVTGRGKKEIKK